MEDAKSRSTTSAEEGYENNQPDSSQSRKQSGPRSMREWNNLIDQRIGEAMEEGAFENLPGTGKPQNLEKNPFVPEGHGLAFDVLQNNNLAPTWITERKEIQGEIAKLRKSIQTEAAWHRTQLLETNDDARRQWLQKTWQRCKDHWNAQIVELNTRINTLNLNQPISHLELIKLRLEDELIRIGANDQLAI
ncbi:DUF1992 domain-containing protein [Chloroflexi bacterium TSY]|nr:DUF1992 domain-containing protein [Chloroflexi bacterium TSY]